MSCQSLHEAIVEVARGQAVGPGTAAALETHVSHCAACAARLARERQLTEGLRALANSADRTASPEIERRLCEAFAAQAAPPPIAAPADRWWLRLAAALIVAVGALVAWRASLGPLPVVEPAPAAPIEKPSNVIIADGFVPLPIAVGLPPFESGEIVRVEIPVSSLPSYGLEVVPDPKRTPVQADILIGQDGHARAIRLVGSSPVTP